MCLLLSRAFSFLFQIFPLLPTSSSEMREPNYSSQLWTLFANAFTTRVPTKGTESVCASLECIQNTAVNKTGWALGIWNTPESSSVRLLLCHAYSRLIKILSDFLHISSLQNYLGILSLLQSHPLKFKSMGLWEVVGWWELWIPAGVPFAQAGLPLERPRAWTLVRIGRLLRIPGRGFGAIIFRNH